MNQEYNVKGIKKIIDKVEFQDLSRYFQTGRKNVNFTDLILED